MNPSDIHAARHTLWPRLTSAAPSRHLTTSVAHLSPGAERQTSQGKTRDLHPIYPPHLLPHLLGDYRASDHLASSPRCGCLICGSCLSGRDFACSFLQIQDYSRHPCCSANVPTTRVRRGLTPPSHQLDTTSNRTVLTHRAPCLAYQAKWAQHSLGPLTIGVLSKLLPRARCRSQCPARDGAGATRHRPLRPGRCRVARS